MGEEMLHSSSRSTAFIAGSFCHFRGSVSANYFSHFFYFYLVFGVFTFSQFHRTITSRVVIYLSKIILQGGQTVPLILE